MTHEEAIQRTKNIWATFLAHLRETPKSFDDMIEIEKYHIATKMAIAALRNESNRRNSDVEVDT